MEYNKETLQKAIDKLDGLLWSYQNSMIPQSMDACIRHKGIEDGIRESIEVLESLMNGETPKFERELELERKMVNSIKNDVTNN